MKEKRYELVYNKILRKNTTSKSKLGTKSKQRSPRKKVSSKKVTKVKQTTSSKSKTKIKRSRKITSYQKYVRDESKKTKYKGMIKPFAQRVKDAIERGEAEYSETAGKHTYVYSFNNRG